MKRNQARRYDVLDAIRKNERASVRELCEMTGIKAPSQVYMHMYQLEAEGRIVIEHGKARGIHVVTVEEDRPKPDWRKSVSLRRAMVQIRQEAGRATKAKAGSPSQRSQDERDRINAVVTNAKEHPVRDDARVYVRPNGVKVIVMQKTHWVSDVK